MNEGCCELLNISAAKRTRRLIVLGASGSVGGSTIDFLEAMPSVQIELTALSVHGSVDRLREILKRFPNTRHAAVSDADAFARAPFSASICSMYERARARLCAAC